MTWNSAGRLEHWITRTLEYADEVVLLVDESSTDDTYHVARTFADLVRVVEHPPFHRGLLRPGAATGER